MKKQRTKQKSHQKYVLPMFIIASSLVFAILFSIVIMPAVVTKFGFEPMLLLLLVTAGVTSALLTLLFYLLLKKEIKV